MEIQNDTFDISDQLAAMLKIVDKRIFWHYSSVNMCISILLGTILLLIATIMWQNNRYKKINNEIYRMRKDLEVIVKREKKRIVKMECTGNKCTILK